MDPTPDRCYFLPGQRVSCRWHLGLLAGDLRDQQTPRQIARNDGGAALATREQRLHASNPQAILRVRTLVTDKATPLQRGADIVTETVVRRLTRRRDRGDCGNEREPHPTVQ